MYKQKHIDYSRLNKTARAPLARDRELSVQKTHFRRRGSYYCNYTQHSPSLASGKLREEENMFKISLKTARESCGYTAEEVAEYCGIPCGDYDKVEIDPSQIQLSLICKIVTLYGAPLSLIYPGTEADCINHNYKKA